VFLLFLEIVLQMDGYFYYLFFIMTRQQFTESKYHNYRKKKKIRRVTDYFAHTKWQKGTFNIIKINDIYLREWRSILYTREIIVNRGWHCTSMGYSISVTLLNICYLFYYIKCSLLSFCQCNIICLCYPSEIFFLKLYFDFVNC
jgi:hypothetical protein